MQYKRKLNYSPLVGKMFIPTDDAIQWFKDNLGNTNWLTEIEIGNMKLLEVGKTIEYEPMYFYNNGWYVGFLRGNGRVGKKIEFEYDRTEKELIVENDIVTLAHVEEAICESYVDYNEYDTTDIKRLFMMLLKEVGRV